jgi:3-oxoadipate enol-lactonase
MATSRFADAAGVRIHYQDSGAGPPLVLLNGWTGSGLIWPPVFIGLLERELRVLRVCNRGTGRSERVREPFTLADMAADTVAVLDAEGVAQAHVFGLSMGGMVAQTLAVRHPRRLERLVLAASCPPRPAFVEVPPEMQQRLFTPPPPGTPLDEAVGRMWGNLVAPGTAGRHQAVLDRLVADVVAAPTPVQVIMLQWQAMAGAPPGVEPLAEIAAPTLVLHGADDPLLPVGNGRALGELIPGARYLELPGVGHLIPWEIQQQAAQLVLEFLLGG